MKRTYYLFNPGRLSRKDNTLKFTPVDEEGREGQVRYIPIETVDNLFVYGSLDANSALYNFLGKNQVAVHFFDYYEHYTGSFMPKEYLLSGRMQIAQMKYHIRKEKRMNIARSFIQGAAFNMLKNLRYYNNRGKDTIIQIERIESYVPLILTANDIPMLMGIEGNVRQTYYEAFDKIIDGFVMGNRSKMPPSNEVNAMISFVNSMCYALCLDAIHHTQLNPTISYLHEPGERRYSLALDVAEIFKPILADRLIFSMFNRRQIQKSDFDQKLNGCLLKPAAVKKVVQEWEERTKETIKHRTLGRSVSYKHLIKLECYKLTKHMLGIEEYKPLKMWWYVILVYDVDQKRTSKMLKLCRRYLSWIQNSVFEGQISEVQLKQLALEAKRVMEDEDSLIVFKSREEKWLQKEIIGNEKASISNFL